MSATATPQMRPDYTPHARAERLIAAGRFVLALSSLAAIYLEPSTPAKYQQSTYALLTIYTVFSGTIVLYAWRSPVPSRAWRLVSHALDLVLFSIFVYLTEGPASPFFLYFIFSLFCATLRFTWRGILATGVTAMAIYGAMALVASLTDPAFEASRVLVREAYLGVIAALLVYLGLYQQRLRSELASLAAWPRQLASRLDDLLRATLAHAAAVLNAPRVMLLWEESEEPWIYEAVWSRGAFTLERRAPGTFESSPGLINTSFFVRTNQPTLHFDPVTGTVREVVGSAASSDFLSNAEEPPGTGVIGVSLASETLSAHLFIPGIRTATADDLALAHIAGRLVLATLEQFFFVQQVRQTASAEERLRISRELHDGIVQSLGGVGLQLQSIRTQLGGAAAERLAHVQRVVEHDQRELRTIVRELRPHDARDGGTILSDELERLRERFPLEWGLDVGVEVPSPIDLPPRLAHELSRILNESLSNAARHGGASRADVRLEVHDGIVHLRVSDNGRGFPFTGRYDLRALDESGHGPRTLKERVTTLGGSLLVESSPSGAVVETRLPVRLEAAE